MWSSEGSGVLWFLRVYALVADWLASGSSQCHSECLELCRWLQGRPRDIRGQLHEAKNTTGPFLSTTRTLGSTHRIWVVRFLGAVVTARSNKARGRINTNTPPTVRHVGAMHTAPVKDLDTQDTGFSMFFVRVSSCVFIMAKWFDDDFKLNCISKPDVEMEDSLCTFV